MPVPKLVGVYNCDAGIAGHISYAAMKLSGRGGCALCDITHGRIFRKAAFNAERKGFELALIYRDQMPRAMKALDADLPAVFVLEGSGPKVLLDRETLQSMDSNEALFFSQIKLALASRR